MCEGDHDNESPHMVDDDLHVVAPSSIRCDFDALRVQVGGALFGEVLGIQVASSSGGEEGIVT